ncbi:MAG: tRNA (adenosine(37)-N6)-dimethylallyltransferase MiaA [Neisseria sp.]|nr:tRNA (adenosine(37)-N6)-dimethylallyltransferase MiaA [Neisseria sp.]
MDCKAFVLLGPTASGKSDLALRLAQRLPAEIVSLDSALIYRKMDIGTAKPAAEERARVPHHLIDVADPTDTYSAASFVADCVRLCREISARGRLPLIAGGTMMYFHALTGGLSDLPQADGETRRILQGICEAEGLEGLYRRLQKADAATAARLQPGDKQRIGRALEIFMLTGKPMSVHLAERQSRPAPLATYTLALFPQDRERLHGDIARRFDLMLAQGFLDEVRGLKEAFPALTGEHNSMRCVGYRQAWNYLAGRCTYDEFKEGAVAATRQLAKRQLTWLRKLPADLRADPYGGDIFPTALDAAERFFNEAG